MRRPASTPQERPAVGGVGALGADALGQHGEHAREQRVARRIETEAGRTGGERVDVLRPTDGAAVHGLDVDETGLPEPFEVQADRVGVQTQPVGQLGRREGRGGTRELLIHRESGLVAEGFQDGEQVHCLTVLWESGIFSRSRLVLFVT